MVRNNLEKGDKKIIIYPAGIWAERLLPIDSLKQIAYFISGELSEGDQGRWHERPVYPISKLLKEIPDEVIIIIADFKYYKDIAEKLNQMGFTENEHYFDGWHLTEEYFLKIKENEWQEYEKADTFLRRNWDERAAIMVTMIPKDVHSIIDFGCGNQRLKDFLRPDIQYMGLDYKSRGENTIVCDINRDSLPQINADCAYMAGFLMYVKNLEGFIRQINTKYILLSYEGREGYDSYGLFQSRGVIPCVENHKKIWDIIQLVIDNQYGLIKISGRHRETFCLFEKQNR